MSTVPHLQVVKSETLPPHDLDVEAAVLATTLIDPEALPKLDAFLRPEMFFSESHRRIFEACIELRGAKQKVEVVAVANWLRDRGRIDQVGGMRYLLELINGAEGVANIVRHGEIVHEKWRVRQTIVLAQSIAARGYLDYGVAQEFIDDATRSIAEISRMSLRSATESNAAALRRLVRSIAAADPTLDDENRGRTGILTGIRGFDAITHGMHAGQKITITALPKVGKTALAVQIGGHVAAQNIGVTIFSQEMEKDDLLLRLLSNWAAVDGDKIKAQKAGNRCLTDDEVGRLKNMSEILGKFPLVIDYCPNITMEQVRARSIALVEQMRTDFGVPLGLIILDYIQRTPASRADVRAGAKKHEYIANNSKAFKLLLQELKIPGIELAQQKTTPVDPKTKTRQKPTKGMTADSSDIEKESDVVAYLHRKARKDYAGRVLGEDSRAVSLIIAAHRNGKEGEVALDFMNEYSRFADATPKDDAGGDQ